MHEDRRHRGHPHHRVRGGARSRWLTDTGHWQVRARVERFVEPAVLLLLHEGPKHGYELMERLTEFGDREVDAGNLYRILRALEEEGMVSSKWNADLPGPAKRTYRLTPEGRRLLDRWIEALRRTRAVIGDFLNRYDAPEGG
jgi:PadR family transcriptional regulator PadR